MASGSPVFAGPPARCLPVLFAPATAKSLRKMPTTTCNHHDPASTTSAHAFSRE